MSKHSSDGIRQAPREDMLVNRDGSIRADQNRQRDPIVRVSAARAASSPVVRRSGAPRDRAACPANVLGRGFQVRLRTSLTGTKTHDALPFAAAVATEHLRSRYPRLRSSGQELRSPFRSCSKMEGSCPHPFRRATSPWCQGPNTRRRAFCSEHESSGKCTFRRVSMVTICSAGDLYLANHHVAWPNSCA